MPSPIPIPMKGGLRASLTWILCGFIYSLLILSTGYHLGSSTALYNFRFTSYLPTRYPPSIKPIEDTYDRPLITYVYFESPNARRNAIFFINHGLHGEADFIFIINGPSTIISKIPQAPNIRVVQRENTCYDLGAHAEVLTADNHALIRSYKRFIMLNASIRGPFLPSWSRECWSDAYLAKVTDRNKLVGMTFNCNVNKGKFNILNSMIYATDRVGLRILLKVTGHCFRTFRDAINAENHAADAILDEGYNVTALMSAFMSLPDYAHQCTHGSVLRPNSYFGTDLHPYEMIFQKANRDIATRQLELLTQWHDSAKYSSWDACARVREERDDLRFRSIES